VNQIPTILLKLFPMSCTIITLRQKILKQVNKYEHLCKLISLSPFESVIKTSVTSIFFIHKNINRWE